MARKFPREFDTEDTEDKQAGTEWSQEAKSLEDKNWGQNSQKGTPKQTLKDAAQQG